ncbi:MAG: dihydrofolate reductase [Bacteroides sp.]|nr:dihydrofolate reductase [Bacteroides sp.]
MSEISIIVATDKNRAIGYKNQLLFRLPDDLKRFKALTTGHTIIMGRKTFESLPKGALPDRRNLVLSRKENLSYPDTEIFHSLEAAVNACKEEAELFIIGGESIYREALPLATRLYLTEIEATAPRADAFFPQIDLTVWQEKSREFHPTDEKHPCSFAFVDYIRK